MKTSLDRRRRDLKNAIDPTVPRTLKGPDAPTESERTAHEITCLPPTPWSTTCVLKRVIETPHAILTTSERDERPIIAMDFEVRKARAEDGGVDGDLGKFLAIVGSSTGCMRAVSAETRGVKDCLASSVSDFVKHLLLVGRFRLRCDSETAIKAVAKNAKPKMSDRVLVEITLQDTKSHWNQQSGHGWLDTLDFVSRDRRVERVASHRSERMTEITRKKLFQLQKLPS